MPDLSDLITVLVCTSPTASDPDTSAIEETIASVRAFDALAQCEIRIGADGVRPEQRDLTVDYDEKYTALIATAILDPLIRVRRLDRWGHQANVVRMMLSNLTTPLVLFLEHDTPLTVAPDVKIDWEGCAETILSGELHLIRFLHESRILPDYQHLMIDHEVKPRIDGPGGELNAGEAIHRVPYLRTAQWSQRPHLASTVWYRWIIDTYFAPSSRCFIEDAMHGVVSYFWREQGLQGCTPFRLAVYADAEPTMQRSYHLDGRGGGSKYEQVFAFPGDTQPEGAPMATLARVFE